MLDDQSNRTEAQPANSSDSASKSDTAKKSDDSKDDNSGDTQATNNAAGGADSENGAVSANPAGDAGTAAAPDAAKGPAAKRAGKAAVGGAKTTPSGDAAASNENAVNASVEVDPSAAAEQGVTPVDEKQGGDGKSKAQKAATTAKPTDGSESAVLTVAACSAAPAASAPETPAELTVSQQASKTGDGSHPTDAITGKATAKSTLRAEDSIQPGKTDKQAAKQSATVAAGPADASSPSTDATPDAVASADADVAPVEHPAAKGDLATFAQQLTDATAQKTNDVQKITTAQPAAPPAPTVADFAAANHAQIVSSVHTQLLPNGGSMQIRLDPPDLGAMQITVHMRDGVMSAEFQASNDQTAKLLSHSLGDLKTQLETQGVTVEKLHVTAAPRESRGGSNGSDARKHREQAPSDDQRREQQRKEMLRRMWSKLAKGDAPLDMVA